MAAEPTVSGEEMCWICLEPGTVHNDLRQPCQCPRYVHTRCLARWQLQSAGKEEETHCRFCKATLPDWRTSYPARQQNLATPVLTVTCKGRTHRLTARPGPEGCEEFKTQLQQIFGISTDMSFSITFNIKTPQAGGRLQLHGLACYDAAFYCAAVTAGCRAEQRRNRQSTSPGQEGQSSQAASSLPTALTFDAAPQSGCPAFGPTAAVDGTDAVASFPAFMSEQQQLPAAPVVPCAPAQQTVASVSMEHASIPGPSSTPVPNNRMSRGPLLKSMMKLFCFAAPAAPATV